MRYSEFFTEGANMTAAYKDEKTGYWTYPDAYAKDPDVEAPYLSNASVREILSTLGLDPDFEENTTHAHRSVYWCEHSMVKKEYR
jgi:hypothetical protein